MANVSNDSFLWYNVGKFGEAGYAVPNWGDNVATLNPNIAYLVDVIGRNVFSILQHTDADLRTPPSVNTLIRVHRLYVRVGQVLAARAVAPGTPNMETQHVTPSGQIFKVYPSPYFKVRNPFLKMWAGWAFISLIEAMQHTENRKSIEISNAFAGLIGQYYKRIYVNMSTELFGKSVSAASADGFLLQDSDFSSYDPSKFFTSTELIDTVPPFNRIFTENALSVLSEGIYVTDLPSLSGYPTDPIQAQILASQDMANQVANYTGVTPGSGSTAGVTSNGVATAPVIPPPPTP